MLFPANFVYEEIRRVRKIYTANNDKDNIKCAVFKEKKKIIFLKTSFIRL